jgi:hypothetical protein
MFPSKARDLNSRACYALPDAKKNQTKANATANPETISTLTRIPVAVAPVSNQPHNLTAHVSTNHTSSNVQIKTSDSENDSKDEEDYIKIKSEPVDDDVGLSNNQRMTFHASSQEETSDVEAQAASGVESSAEKSSGVEAKAATSIDEPMSGPEKTSGVEVESETEINKSTSEQQRASGVELQLKMASPSQCRDRRGRRVLRLKLTLR